MRMDGRSTRCANAKALATWLAVLLAVCAALPCLAADDLQARVERAIAEEGITGAVWALDTGTSVQAGAAGLAAKDRPMHPDARVHVGSIAKAVLATGVLRLATEGRLDLDSPVTDLIPGLAFDNPWQATHSVRVRHLLDHTAGLDDMRLSQFFSLRAHPDMPLAEALAIDAPLRVRSRPGSRFSYSNTGYALLGRVIESVTGQRYEHYLDEAVLRPLGMRDSTFAFTTQVGAAADARLAMGHFEAGNAHAAVPVDVRPAAQLTTTGADMLRFARFIVSDGRIDGTTFIAPDLMRARARPQGTEAAKAGLATGYALGLTLRDRHGAVGVCHGGDTVGFRAMVCAYPAHGRAFFIAFNADVEGADYTRIRGLLVEALGVAIPPRATSASPAADLDTWEGLYVPAPNRFASFAYLDRLFGVRHVAWKDGALHVRPLQGTPLRLAPAGGRLFRQSERVLPSHALLVGDDGARVLVDDQQTLARTALMPFALLWASLIVGILGIAYVLIVGVWRLLRRRPWRTDALRLPWASIVALLVPVPLFLRQPFLQFGDPTVASVSLAIVTALLPITVLTGLYRIRYAPRSRPRLADSLALLAVLQWCAVLATSGLLPLRTWAL